MSVQDLKVYVRIIRNKNLVNKGQQFYLNSNVYVIDNTLFDWLVKFFITNVMEMPMTESWNPLIFGYELAQISLFFSEHVYMCVCYIYM